jgi:hypothetical protein
MPNEIRTTFLPEGTGSENEKVPPFQLPWLLLHA